MALQVDQLKTDQTMIVDQFVNNATDLSMKNTKLEVENKLLQ
jgi:hypothetical protein